MTELKVGSTIFTVDFELRENKLNPIVYRNTILKITPQLYITERCDGLPVMVLSDSGLAFRQRTLPLHCVDEHDIPQLIQSTLTIMDKQFDERLETLSKWIVTLEQRKEFFIHEISKSLFASYKKLNNETIGLFVFDIVEENVIKARLLTEPKKNLGGTYLVTHPVFKEKGYPFEENHFNDLLQIEYDSRYSFAIPLRLEDPILKSTVSYYIEEAIADIMEGYKYEKVDIMEQRHYFNRIHSEPTVQFYE